jgi:drug/metabolite transporter (DMT)-like permease
VTRKALLLFMAASVIWGSSFLFIRLAVEHMPPATVVFCRTLLGAAFLVPLAASRRAFHDVRAWLATRRQATPGVESDSGEGLSPGDTAMQSRRAKTLAGSALAPFHLRRAGFRARVTGLRGRLALRLRV